jgi:hypothetical protein
MFVLVSTIADPYATYARTKSMKDLMTVGGDECVLGVFTSKELAAKGIDAYAGTSHAGKTALIYQMVPDGIKQKRVKIYEGSFPLCTWTSTSSTPMKKQPPVPPVKETPATPSGPTVAYLNGLSKIMSKRLQKLEEKLESKCTECNRLKTDNEEMTSLVNRMKAFIQV